LMSPQKLAVLNFLQTLAPNKVTTYKALAVKFHTHPRAIASYMRTNKELDKYPCYKVVANDGGLSGYVL
jgi:O6-methylguanine-DNA--protein-cysteine methyltransferase